MKRETQDHELGEYGFRLVLQVRRDRPWPDGAIAMARENPHLPPGASDLEAIAQMIADVCGEVAQNAADENALSVMSYPGRAERN